MYAHHLITMTLLDTYVYVAPLSGTIVLSGSPFDAYDVITCVHSILCPMASIKGIDITLEPNPTII